MHDTLQKEIALYEKRTPKSAEAHKKAEKRIPLGVASNYRHYEPYPIFVKDGKGSKIHDIDGNEYIDHNLCFGALMAGHCHPAVVKAVEEKLHEGTTFGMPHDQEWELAEEICKRYPVEMVRFGSKRSCCCNDTSCDQPALRLGSNPEVPMGHLLSKRLFAILLGCGLAVTFAGEAVAHGRPIYPWCAFYNASGGMVDCRYYDIAQCRASVSGLGGFCYRNLEYVEPLPPRRLPRVKRKPRH